MAFRESVQQSIRVRGIKSTLEIIKLIADQEAWDHVGKNKLQWGFIGEFLGAAIDGPAERLVNTPAPLTNPQRPGHVPLESLTVIK